MQHMHERHENAGQNSRGREFVLRQGEGYQADGGGDLRDVLSSEC
jgi:hypothetical protein